MGPVGVGVAVLEAAVVVETEVKVLLRPIGTILAELEPVAIAAVDVNVEVPLVEYMLRRFGPPQYSMGFPEHVIEHCVVAGVMPATSTEPALITFPQ